MSIATRYRRYKVRNNNVKFTSYGISSKFKTITQEQEHEYMFIHLLFIVKYYTNVDHKELPILN